MENPYKITRSYERTVQVKQYEPERFYSEHEAKIDMLPVNKETQEKIIKELSEVLYKFAKEDVERAISERLGSAEKEISTEDSPY